MTETKPRSKLIDKPKDDWNDNLDAAPRDGRKLILTPDGSIEVICFYKKTRQFRKGNWQHIEFWAVEGSNAAITFEPLAWKEKSTDMVWF